MIPSGPLVAVGANSCVVGAGDAALLEVIAGETAIGEVVVPPGEQKGVGWKPIVSS